MIEIPDSNKSFEFENNFYLSSDITRISKILARYELFKMVLELPGEIIDLGVAKGVSLIKFATFRELFSSPYQKKIIGFDMFGEFPETGYEPDKKHIRRDLKRFGRESISQDQLNSVLQRKGIDRHIELVQGNIVETVPKYLESHPELRVSLINLDVDIFEPSVVVLEKLYPRIVRGGVMILDDYGVYPGETKAVDEYFRDMDVEIKKFPFCMTPCYVVKR